ncbi:MAG TPA: TIGR01244 family sulfur transferase [Hyphomonadaceae bacterium]|nr:TIGR01244 family sulfur transferase [Hyphomonadaceae bacterium]
MADIRRVTDRFSVAPQLEIEDFETIRALGFRHLINNRPDGETPDQPSSAEQKAAAEKLGLSYVHAPFVGQPSQEAVEAAAKAETGTLAYCRSGTRSVTAWAIAQATRGEKAEEIIRAAASAGYNLGGLGPALRQLGAI